METQGKMIKFPFQPGPSPPTLTPVQKSVLENLPMILYRALEVADEEEGRGGGRGVRGRAGWGSDHFAITSRQFLSQLIEPWVAIIIPTAPY